MDETDTQHITEQTKEVLVLEKALEAFQRTTGLKAQCEQFDATLNGRRFDAIVRIGDPREEAERFVVEIKRIDRFDALRTIRNTFFHTLVPYPLLLVAPYITPDAAEKCREMNLPFIDTHGNAFIATPKIFIYVKGQRKAEDEPELIYGKATTATALRVVFVLLCDDGLLNAPYRQIAKAANVALGTVGWTFFDLDARGFTTGGKGKQNRRVLLERKKLIDEWVTNYPIKLRPKLGIRRLTAIDKNWWRDIDIKKYDGGWGGEIAADHYTGNLRPATVTIYVGPAARTEKLGRLIADKRLRPDPKGEIEVLERFWNLDEWEKENNFPNDAVPPLLVYADLLATLDPRDAQVGRDLYKKWIAHADAKT